MGKYSQERYLGDDEMEKGFIFSLILAVIVGIFAVSNGERVEVDFIFTKIYMSQAIVIFISTFLGAVIVAIIGWIKSWRYKRQIKDLNKKIQSLEDDKIRILQDVEKKEEQIKTLYNRNNQEIEQNSEL